MNFFHSGRLATSIAVAAVACTLFADNVAAEGHEVVVAIRVSSQGLDIRQPAGAQKFYERLKQAADVACTHGNQVGLEYLPNPAACYEKALGGAVRSVNAPLVTRIYLQTHTISRAAALGINVPAQMAAK